MNPARVPKRLLIEGALLAALAMAVCLPWGCSTPLQHTTGPAWNSTFKLPNGVIAYPGTPLNEADQSTQDPALVPLCDSTTVTLTFESEVGVTGGVVDMPLSDSEHAHLTVPPGALLANTVIKADVSRNSVGLDQRFTHFEFGPDGLVFRIPAMLTVRADNPEGTVLDLEWWDPARELWVPSAEAVVVVGHATFPMMHFSDYRVVERVSLGGQQKHK